MDEFDPPKTIRPWQRHGITCDQCDKTASMWLMEGPGAEAEALCDPHYEQRADEALARTLSLWVNGYHIRDGWVLWLARDTIMSGPFDWWDGFTFWFRTRARPRSQ